MPILNVRAEGLSNKGKVLPAPELLSGAGPVIPVTISLSDKCQQVYSDQRKKLPQSISGLALIDTGASITCFDESTTVKAGLPIVDTTIMTSASHAHNQVHVFMGKIVLTPANIIINVEKGLGANLSAFNGLVALIGRDLLKSAIFTYNGPDGLISISL